MNSMYEEDPAIDFDYLYSQSEDPWHIENRWYEHRKRALILASLPFETAELIVEPGCGTGALTQQLAGRCAQLFACDTSAQAVALARERLVDVKHVHLSCLKIPHQWPVMMPGTADCVVLSEIGYYLTTTELPLLIAHIGLSLKPSGCLVACHWRKPFVGRTLPTSTLHDALASGLGLQEVVHHMERDFILDIWSRDGCSVAMQEGFA